MTRADADGLLERLNQDIQAELEKPAGEHVSTELGYNKRFLAILTEVRTLCLKGEAGFISLRVSLSELIDYEIFYGWICEDSYDLWINAAVTVWSEGRLTTDYDQRDADGHRGIKLLSRQITP